MLMPYKQQQQSPFYNEWPLLLQGLQLGMYEQLMCQQLPPSPPTSKKLLPPMICLCSLATIPSMQSNYTCNRNGTKTCCQVCIKHPWQACKCIRNDQYTCMDGPLREQVQYPKNCYEVQNYEQLGRLDVPTDTILFPSTSQLRDHTEKLQQPCRVNAYYIQLLLLPIITFAYVCMTILICESV